MKALPTPAPELGVREPGPADILLAAGESACGPGQAPQWGSGLLKALAESESDHVALWECCSVTATSCCTQKERSKEPCQSWSSDSSILPR